MARSIWSEAISVGQAVLPVLRHCRLVREVASSTTLTAGLEQELTPSH